MDDKAVGQLFAKYRPWSGLNGMELQAAKDNVALIRKLVEDRAKLHFIDDNPERRSMNDQPPKWAISRALRDFGIKRAEFNVQDAPESTQDKN